MSLWSAGRARAVVLSLAAVASAWWSVAAAPAAGSSTPAGQPSAPALSLVSQSSWVTPPQPGAAASFGLTLATGGAPAGAEVSVALYSHLITRSAFELTLRSAPTGIELDHTRPVPVSSLPAGGRGAVSLSVAVLPSPATAAPAGAPSLDLHCSPTTGTCTGVYPAVVSLLRPASDGGGTIARFTTYLTYATSKSAHPLRFAWVVPIAVPPTGGSGAGAPGRSQDVPVRPSSVAAFGKLVDQLRASAPAVPVTLEPAPQTLQSFQAAGGDGPSVVQGVAALSANQTSFEIPTQPFVPVDLGALANAGEGGEISGQMAAGAAVLDKLGVQTSTTSSPWVATGAVGSALGSGLSQVKAQEVVVPTTDLAPPTNGYGGTWASTFDLSLKGTTVTAAASDKVLASQFATGRHDPALAAEQLLADLAMVHAEAPNARTARGLVAVPPPGWVPNSTFDRVLLQGLQGNPDVQPVTLTGLFAAVPRDGSRKLGTPGSGPDLSPSFARQVSSARLRLTAFDSAVVGNPPVLSRLDQLLLSSESDELRRGAGSAVVAAFDRSLHAQLRLIQFSEDRTITLTARTGWIPITVVSGAKYTVIGTLSVSSAKFEFPHHSSKTLKLDHATNPVRIDVVARTSGDLPLQAVFSSPQGGLVIAEGQLTVRSTATSLVGIVLTAVALAVLLGWWARTWRASRRRRRAGHPRRAAAP